MRKGFLHFTRGVEGFDVQGGKVRISCSINAREGKHGFFSFNIRDRAAEDEQVHKRIEIQPCIPEIWHAKV